MQFTQIELTVNDVDHTFDPYDRGANGAFVYREVGGTLHQPRLVVSTKTDDAGSDRYSVQLNAPRIQSAAEGCCEADSVLGTDLVKTELRFLATTNSQARLDQIDLHIAALQEFRTAISNREKLWT